MSAIKTNPVGTDTSIGMVPHITFRGIRCPVKLKVVEVDGCKQVAMGRKSRPIPAVNANGRLIHALPTGEEFLGRMYTDIRKEAY